MTSFELGAKARAAGYRLKAFDSIGSTNTEALAAAAAGDPGGLWFAALQQTAGRGRRGRVWASPHGNLAATLLIVPDADPAIAATLGFVAGISLNLALTRALPSLVLRFGIDGADAAGGEGRTRIALKWPNDVLADGAKLAGILLEGHRRGDGRQAVAIGFGVNIVAAPEGLPYPATALAEMGSSADAAAIFAQLTDAWVESFSIWNEGQGVGAVLDLWRSAAAGIGSEVAVVQNGATVRGIFETIDDGGRLIIRAANDERIAITAGDVHFGATASARS